MEGGGRIATGLTFELKSKTIVSKHFNFPGHCTACFVDLLEKSNTTEPKTANQKISHYFRKSQQTPGIFKKLQVICLTSNLPLPSYPHFLSFSSPFKSYISLATPLHQIK